MKEKFTKVKETIREKVSKIKLDKRILLIVAILLIFAIAVSIAFRSNDNDKTDNASSTTTEQAVTENTSINKEAVNKLAAVEKSIKTAEGRVKSLHPKITKSTIKYYLDEVQAEMQKLKDEGVINSFDRSDTNIIIDLGVYYAYAPVIEDAETSK